MILISLTVFSLPFTAWFALNPWLRFPVILLLIMFFVTLININVFLQKFDKVKLNLSDFLIFLFALMCALSSLININHFIAKDLNNFIAIMFAVFVMYLAPKIFFEYTITENNIARLNNTINVTYIVVSFLVIIDFLLVNLFDYRIHDLFVISWVGNADYFIRSGGLITPAGPAEEPATTAFFLNILFFLSVAFCKLRLIAYMCFFLWHILCLSALGSSAGLVFFMLSVFLASLFFFKKQYLTWFVFIAILALFLYPYIFDYLDNISLFQKIFLREENISSSLRMHSWEVFYNSLFDGYKEMIFGHSPAYSKLVVETGFHSSYFTILSNYGIIAFIIYILFLLNFFITYAIRQNLFVLAAFLVIIFSSAVSDYYYQPIIWVSLVIIMINQKYRRSGLPPESG